MPKSKTKKQFTRRIEKRYPLVRFTVPTFEEEFELPDTASFELGVQRALGNGDPGPMFSLIRRVGNFDAELDAIEDLQGDEVEQFMKAWRDAGTVDPGKSSD